MKANELRQAYVEFFKAQPRNHRHVSSAPIVPPDDPTLMFTSAGMVQFKPLYSGTIELPYRRAVSVQKCLRAGGKGSDLENVGKTLRHHTFFEMLGNFSFGDYFKREALEWGWDFVWNVMKLPKERLWATTYEKDPETAELLEKDFGFSRSRIIPLDEKENFWGPAGGTGACGPCSEIIFFTGTEEELAIAAKQDVPTIAKRIVDEGDLFLEIWNMVFPQYDQQPDGSRPPLKNRGIDTGAGLERMTTAMQFIASGGKIRSPYQTDLLKPIVLEAAKHLGTSQFVENIFEHGIGNKTEDELLPSFATNAVSDHVRALTFAIAEGILPSNDGRGYVIRRILRRALRFASLTNLERGSGGDVRDVEPFMHKLVDSVIEVMGESHPEIVPMRDYVKKVIRIDEENFLRTMKQGEKRLRELIDGARQGSAKALRGEDVFELHATFGFPPEMTYEIVEELNNRAGAGNQVAVDAEGYDRAMSEHKAQARRAWRGAKLSGHDAAARDILEEHGPTKFLGYDLVAAPTRVAAIFIGEQRVEKIDAGQDAIVVLDETPFYAEAGGQIGDSGALAHNGSRFEVADTQKTESGLYLHSGKAALGGLKVGDAVEARVDAERRGRTIRNHTATHLLQSALKQVLGKHVTQAGSSVTPRGLRFDFSHLESVKPAELHEVEEIVNAEIRRNASLTTRVLPKDEAFALGAIAPFGEKYGEIVRVVMVPEFSTEFCGGTHVRATGDIGMFLIQGESSIASGVRRIEAVTGEGAYEWAAKSRERLGRLSQSLAAPVDDIEDRIKALQDEAKSLRKELEKARAELSTGELEQAIARSECMFGATIIAHEFHDLDGGQLRNLADVIRNKCGTFVAFLASKSEGKAALLCAVSKDLADRAPANELIRDVAAVIGGTGGGKKELAQAGGKHPEKIAEALALVPKVVEARLSK